MSSLHPSTYRAPFRKRPVAVTKPPFPSPLQSQTPLAQPTRPPYDDLGTHLRSGGAIVAFGARSLNSGEARFGAVVPRRTCCTLALETKSCLRAICPYSKVEFCGRAWQRAVFRAFKVCGECDMVRKLSIRRYVVGQNREWHTHVAVLSSWPRGYNRANNTFKTRYYLHQFILVYCRRARQPSDPQGVAQIGAV